MTDFVSLHNRTHFSLLGSLTSPKELFNTAKSLGQKAVAVTDSGTLSGVWDSLKASKETGVKLIQGCEFNFVNDLEKKDDKSRTTGIVLLAKNHNGYKNILQLSRAGFENSLLFGNRVVPVIDWKLLEKFSSDLVCLTSSSSGIIGQSLVNKKFEEAENSLKKLNSIFGSNLGIEIQPNTLKRNANNYHDSMDQIFANHHLIKLGQKNNIKIVAATNSLYVKKEDADIHDVLLAIGARQPVYSNARIKYDVDDFYIKSGDEVYNFFARNYKDDAALFCENSLYFSDLCESPEWIDPKFSNPTGKELSIFPVKDDIDYNKYKIWLSDQAESVKKLEEDKSFLRYKCDMAFTDIVPPNKSVEYRNRLIEELDVIEYHGFSSYMLIVGDYINWARMNGIPVGPGRGSVGGSLIAFLLGIHKADPIKYNLIFARFHNKEKSSFPDIDSDFAPSGRDKIKDYIAKKYGQEHVAHVSNVNTITPKVYVKDICRALQLGGSREAAVKLGNEIADSIPAEIKTIEKAFDDAPLFAEYAKRYPELKKYAAICGKYRAWSTHAGGLIISQRPLDTFIPLRKDKDGAIAIEFDKDRAEENGLVKMDILGSETLDIIKNTSEIIIKYGGEAPPLDPDYDQYDKKTYDLISGGDTFGVFQLGTSSGTIDLCRKVKPNCIEDISHINSLARPSARDIRDGFIAAKEGRKKVTLLHPSLKRSFGSTYGFGLYEESLMYLAQDVAGWSLHGADRLRKLTKEKGKNPKKAMQWRQEFIENANSNNNIPLEIATKVWDEVVDKFQGYGFNMSHSVLYSMTSFYTAFLKAHYPIEFLLANLESEISSNAKVAKNNIEKIKQELRNNKVKIVPPDLNKSELTFKLLGDNKLLTGLDALKFVSDDAILDITSKRPFKNFTDFMVRVDSRKVRSNTIQALASSGCLDTFGISRKLIFLYCSDFRKKLQIWLKKHDPSKEEFNYPWPVEKEWSLPEMYALEKSYLGEAFICPKKDAYGKFFKEGSSMTLAEAKKLPNKKVVPSIKAEVKSVFEFKIKKETSKFFGLTMAKVTIEDEFGDQCSLTIFPDRWEKINKRLKELGGNKCIFEEGIAINFGGSVNIYEDDFGIILDNFYGVQPHPSVPADLKAKKVSLKKTKSDEIKTDVSDSSKLLEDIEDQLYDEGLIDFIDNEDDD